MLNFTSIYLKFNILLTYRIFSYIMEFTHNSSKIIKDLMPYMDSARAYKTMENNYDFQTSLDNLLLLLYNEIHRSEKNLKKILSKPSIFKKLFTPVLSSKIIEPTLSWSRFYPKKIRDYIDKTIKYQLVYAFNIGTRKIRVIFSLFTEEDIHNIDKYEKHILFIYSWLSVCNKFSLKRCSNTLDIFLYLTPYNKELPEDRATVLSSEHANTAFTIQCQPKGEIILYREEEWEKVFIHETFHTFGFDIPDNSASDLREFTSKLYPIKSEFRVGEAYVETWARILYCAYASYKSLSDKNDKDNFLLFMRFCLQIERLFAIKQMNKILHFMGLSYTDLIDHKNTQCSLRRVLYNEHTNILAYYVITALFMNDYYGFLQWCAKHNSVIFQYSSTLNTNKYFSAFIKHQYNDPSFLQISIMLGTSYRHKQNKRFLLTSTRMTAIEI